MEKYYEFYHNYWKQYYIEEEKKQRYFYKPPSRDSAEVLSIDRMMKKILARARAFSKFNKKFRNP